MKKKYILALALLQFSNPCIAADQLSYWLGVNTELTDQNQNAYLDMGSEKEVFDNYQVDTLFRGKYKFLYFDAYGVAKRVVEFDKYSSHLNGKINELYLQQTFNDSTVSFGRRVTSWGYGEVFRPLEIVQSVNRRSLLYSPTQGVLSGNYFYSVGDLNTEIVVSETEARQLDKNDSKAAQIAFQQFWRFEGGDAQVVARYEKESAMTFGVGTSRTVTDSLLLFTSMTFQNHYVASDLNLANWDSNADIPTKINTLHSNLGQTISSVKKDNALKANVGGSYAWPNRTTLSFEYWYDGTARSREEWKDIFGFAGDAQGLRPVSSEVNQLINAHIGAINEDLNQYVNLSQHNLYFRIAYIWEKWEPSVDLLANPEDGGIMSSANVDYKLDDILLRFGLRNYGGKSDSVIANLPSSNDAFLTLRKLF